MADKNPRIDLTLGAEALVRFSYLHVFAPHTNTNNGKEEYSTNLYIPKTATATIKQLQDWIAGAKKTMFTDRKKPVPPAFWNPLRDGDKDVKQSGEGYGPAAAGHYVLNAKADLDHAPKIRGTQRGTDGKLIPLTSGVKSGDYGRVGITLYGYTTGDSGVGCGLRTLQFVEAGEALGSEADPDQDFKDFNDEGDVL